MLMYNIMPQAYIPTTYKLYSYVAHLQYNVIGNIRGGTKTTTTKN